MQKALAGLRRINLEGLRWRVFDAKGQVGFYFSFHFGNFHLIHFCVAQGHDIELLSYQVLGRLASQIATVVQGKDKPTYTPYREDGDMCIVLNAKDICVTGRKMTDKFYCWHTG